MQNRDPKVSLDNRHIETLARHLRRVARDYVNLQAADLDDATSYVLLKYWQLARSSDDNEYSRAHRIATEPGYRYAWLRSRFIDFLRQLRSRHAPASLHDDELWKLKMSSVSERSFDSWDVTEFLDSAEGRVVQELGEPYRLILELMIHSALSGVPEKLLALEHGMSPALFSEKKKRLQRLLQRLRGELDELK